MKFPVNITLPICFIFLRLYKKGAAVMFKKYDSIIYNKALNLN